MSTRRIVLSLVIALAGFAACARVPEQPQAPVRVFAAASLTDALTEAGAAYASHGHPAPVFNFAGSSTLARQIEQGADADLFISADQKWMDDLTEKSLIAADSRVTLVGNRLVLIAPSDHPINLDIAPSFALHSALAGGRLAIADPDSVPAGRYGRAALQSLGAWDSVAHSLAIAEDVRAALRLVETGEAAAGIVYATDAQAAGARVQTVGIFPEDSHDPITYPAALVAGSQNSQARGFIDFLASPEAQAIFQHHGFATLQSAAAR